MQVNVEKKILCSMKSAYAVATVVLDGREQVIAVTEGHGPAVLIDPADWSVQEMLPGPGGCMSIAQSTGGEIFAIFGCFPGYQFHEAGVYRIGRENANGPFREEELFRFPFAHRLCVASRHGVEHLVAANLAETKETPDDWARPGVIVAGPVPAETDSEWKPVPIGEKIHRNHCMFTGTLDGRRAMLIGGQEGLYCFDLDSPEEGWPSRLVLSHEVSEAVITDIDGDGWDELITIEPFHGNRLRMYRFDRSGASAWDAALSLDFEASLNFGHGLWAGDLAASASGDRQPNLAPALPVLLLGNRAGSQNLELFAWDRTSSRLERLVVDPGSGSANLAVVRRGGESWIVATNQSSEEVAAYRVELL